MNVSTFLWRYLSKTKRWLIGAFFCISLGELSRQTGFYFASRIAEVLNENSSKYVLLKQAVFYSFLFGVFIQGRTVIHNFHYALDTIFQPRIQTKMTRDLFSYAHKHSMQFFAEEMAGRISGKVMQIVASVIELKHQLFSPLLSFFRISIGFFFLSGIHIHLGLALVVFICFYILFLWYMSQKMTQASVVVYDQETAVNGVLVDTLFNYNIVKNDGNILHEKRSFFEKIKKWVRLERNIYRLDFQMHFIQGVVRSLMQMVFLFIPLYYWLQNEISVADFVLAESLITYLTLFGLNIAIPVANFCKAWGAIQDGLDFIYRPLQITDKKDAKNIQIKKGAIVFKNVSFNYNGKTSQLQFKNFNLNINSKTKVGLVGMSGSGKSSLIKLVMRYYDVLKGKIFIDGIDISKVKQASLREYISVIEQNPSLFNRSIKENIKYGKLTASDEEVITAAKQAYIHDMIMRLPNGYDTVVGERGIILSGGERQRIAIARAILKDAPILILDEATSALDSESEISIQKSLKKIMKNKTVIAIAHRLSTLREMDILLVMKNGKIIEKGTHAQLLKSGGVYSAFYKLQTQSFKRTK